MSLQAAMESDPIRPGGKCPVRILLEGGIPAGSTTDEPLPEKDRTALAAAVAPGSTAVLTRALRYLTGAGYKVGSTALAVHRRRDCSCS